MHTDNGAEAEKHRIWETREKSLWKAWKHCITKWNLHCFLLVENGVGSVLNKEAGFSTKEKV